MSGLSNTRVTANLSELKFSNIPQALVLAQEIYNAAARKTTLIYVVVFTFWGF